jgi:putative tryptophan/tyrosine transport system substrate-binding protein
MKRREFITLLGGTAATWPLAARAQQPAGRVYRVGLLVTASREQQLHLLKAFEQGLRNLGYRVGENVVIEYRFADGKMERCPGWRRTWSGSAWTSSSPGPIRIRLRR